LSPEYDKIKSENFEKEISIMAKKKTLTRQYDELPFILRLLIQIIGGIVVGGIYRLVRYTESKNTVTLVFGILFTFTGVLNIFAWVIDIASLILYKKYAILVD
jgi:uncharacterized membrane protein HdeD (DUF308 family)